MKVKATMTFYGNHGENDDSGFVQMGAVIEVGPNRAGELIRSGAAEEVAEAAPLAAPTAPVPPASEPAQQATLARPNPTKEVK